MPQRFESPKGPHEGIAKVAPSGDVQVDDGDRVYVAEGDLVAGKYRVERILGVGGVGFVVAARHAELGGHVALKFLKKRFLHDKSIAERFTREARAACRIKSDYVARVYDVGSHGRAPFIVMEHLSGRDLAAVLAERGPLPVADAVEYAVQACAALAVAHASSIVHRDIKPENLFLVDEEGTPTVKLLDFGISKLALAQDRPAGEWGPEGEALTGRMTCGTPDYMSPEQIRSTATVDARSDVWSMGMVLFEMLTAKTAFQAETVTDLCTAILEQEPPWLSDLRSEVPLGLSDVVAHCLQKDPGRRFASIAELAVALLPFAPPHAMAIAEGSAWIRRAAIHAVGTSYGGDGRLSGDPLSEPASANRRFSGAMPAFTPATGPSQGSFGPGPASARVSTSVSADNASRLFRPRRPMAVVGATAVALGLLTVWGLVHAFAGHPADAPRPGATAPAVEARRSPPAPSSTPEEPLTAVGAPAHSASVASSPTLPVSESSGPTHASPPPHPRAAPARGAPSVKAPTPSVSAPPPDTSTAPPANATPSVAPARPGPPVVPGRPDLGY